MNGRPSANYAKVDQDPSKLWEKSRRQRRTPTWPGQHLHCQSHLSLHSLLSRTSAGAIPLRPKGQSPSPCWVPSWRCLVTRSPTISPRRFHQSSPAGQWLLRTACHQSRLQQLRRARQPRGDGAHAPTCASKPDDSPGPDGSRRAAWTVPPRTAKTKKCSSSTPPLNGTRRRHAHGDFAGEEYAQAPVRDWAAKGHAVAGHQGRGGAQLRAHPPATWWAWACCRFHPVQGGRFLGVA